MSGTTTPRRSYLHAFLAIALLAMACDARRQVGPTDPDTPDDPGAGGRPLGVVEVTISGIGTPEMRAGVAAPGLRLAEGVSASLTPVSGGGASSDGSIQLEPLTTGTFTEGKRGVDGTRYLYATFRVRNASSDGTPYGAPRTNLTFVAVQTSGTIGQTAVARMNRFDGTAADTAIARFVVPTGAVVLDQSTTMKSLYPDVLQVYTEAEAAAIAAPAGVTGVFPYGFVVRNTTAENSRTLPAAPGPNQFDGIVTFAFRLPLQADATADPFDISMMFLAMDDSTTRVTESLEEQDPTARQAVLTRATALGATVTVLAGGTTSGYPFGSRQECVVRTAGPAGGAATTITSPGAYTKLAVFREGEMLDPCRESWTSGTPASAGIGVPFNIDVRAMDRYGNTLTSISDTITVAATALLSSLPGALPLTAGTVSFTVNPDGYGAPTLTVSGRRLKGQAVVTIAGITRTWTGNASTQWLDGGNWDVAAAPGTRDTVVIPTGRTNYPRLDRNIAIAGIQVQNGATLNIGAFDLTASGDVITASTGQITSTTGRLVLAGSNRVVAGTLPPLRVTGTYSLAGNVTTRGPLRSELGLLRNGGFRLVVNP